ncbi:MAG: CHRD domain-containing protein [Siculibacillus sp.]
MTNSTRTLFGALFLSTALLSLPALAETTAFKATLSAAEEVPAVTSKGMGSAEATYDDATKKLTWKGSYSGLGGPVTAAHFHGPAEVGKTGGVQVPVEATGSPFMGFATLTDAQASDLLGGRLYLNLHTAANPNGEIRGQVVKVK